MCFFELVGGNALELLESNQGIGALVPYVDVLNLDPKSIAFLLSRPSHPPKPSKTSLPKKTSDSACESSEASEINNEKSEKTSETENLEVLNRWCGVSVEDQWHLLASALIEPFIAAFKENICLDLVLDSIHVRTSVSLLSHCLISELLLFEIKQQQQP